LFATVSTKSYLVHIYPLRISAEKPYSTLTRLDAKNPPNMAQEQSNEKPSDKKNPLLSALDFLKQLFSCINHVSDVTNNVQQQVQQVQQGQMPSQLPSQVPSQLPSTNCTLGYYFSPAEFEKACLLTLVLEIDPERLINGYHPTAILYDFTTIALVLQCILSGRYPVRLLARLGCLVQL
jgi:hypothetical protein